VKFFDGVGGLAAATNEKAGGLFASTVSFFAILVLSLNF
jgi:hypothetical protein